MLGNDYRETLDDGKVVLFLRNGIFQARVYRGDRRYIFKSLKTSDLAAARKAAQRLALEVEFRREHQLPLQKRRFSQVIAEYVTLRERQCERSQNAGTNTSYKAETSPAMLRQIKRVVKFWLEYCGNVAVDRIDNAKLRDFVAWRKDYYVRMPAEQRPKNHSLNPADKTLEWESMLGKMILKFADERGYRGKIPLPDYRYKASKAIVRPAFSPAEFATLYRGMRDWTREVPFKQAERRYMRELLRDYVHILAHSGMRVGEANSLRMRDVVKFRDEKGRETYQFHVNGKTGKRIVTPQFAAVRSIETVMQRNRTLKFFRGKPREDRRKTSSKDDWFFRMFNGNQVLTLTDQFQAYLKKMGIEQNGEGEPYTLYSLRHFYAKRMLAKGMPIYDLKLNMGTSVQMIEQYYGSRLISDAVATRLGD